MVNEWKNKEKEHYLHYFHLKKVGISEKYSDAYNKTNVFLLADVHSS